MLIFCDVTISQRATRTTIQNLVIEKFGSSLTEQEKGREHSVLPFLKDLIIYKI